MSEQIDIKRAGKSLFNGLSWFKDGMRGIRIFAIIFVLLLLYMGFKSLFMPNNKQESNVTVEKGGQAKITYVQGDNKKWAVFGEAYVFCESPSRYGVGVRTGIKF